MKCPHCKAEEKPPMKWEEMSEGSRPRPGLLFLCQQCGGLSEYGQRFALRRATQQQFNEVRNTLGFIKLKELRLAILQLKREGKL